MKGFGIRTVFFLCIFVLFLLGCQGDKATMEEKDSKDQIEEVASVSGEKALEDVVAMVGDEAITEADVVAVTPGNVPERRRRMLRTKIIYYLVDTYIYANEAKKMGFHDDPELQKDMEKTRREILAGAFRSKHVDSNIEPTPAEIKAFYDENKETQFIVPEGVMVQQIRTVKKEDAEAALAALRRGEPFPEVALEWSKLVRRKNRQATDWLYRKRIDPALEKAVFALEVGQFSDVIPTGNEHRVVRVMGKSEEKLVAFEDAKSPIRFRLMQRTKKEMIHEFYEKARVKRSPEKGILVQVGDEVFKEEAIAHILDRAKEEEREKFKARWTQYYIDMTVFSKEALNVGLENDPQVARKIKWRTLDVLADAYRERVIENKIEITDADVAEEYKNNSDMFAQPLQFRVGLIVVETRQEAEDVRKRIDNGMTFSVLARQESTHASAEKGGGINWFKEGEQEPVVEEAAKKLERFEVSDILKMKSGYGLIKLMARQGGLQPLEEVAQSIRRVLNNRRMEKEREHYHDKWNARILEQPESLVENPGPAADPLDRSSESKPPEGDK